MNGDEYIKTLGDLRSVLKENMELNFLTDSDGDIVLHVGQDDIEITVWINVTNSEKETVYDPRGDIYHLAHFQQYWSI